MTEFPIKNEKIPFQALTANLKIKLFELKKKQNKELNELYQKNMQDPNFLQEHLTQSEMLVFMDLNSNQISELQSKNPETLTAAEKQLQAQESIQLMKQMQPFIDKIEEITKFLLEDKHLIEYVKACIDNNTLKKENKKLFDAIQKEEYWGDVPVEELERIRDSFRK